MNTNEVKVEAYVREFSRLALLIPGTPDFTVEETALSTLWDSLSDEEKALAHERVQPYREKLLKGSAAQ